MKHFFSQFLLGLVSYPRAIKFVVKHNLYLYFLFPLSLSLLIWWGGYELRLDLEDFEVEDPGSMRGLIWVMAKMILLKTLIFLLIEARKYIVMIILSPVMYKLSFRSEELLTGNTYATSWKQYWTDTKRALRILFGNFVVQYAISLVWIVFAMLFPPLRDYTSGVLLAIGFYFYGFSFMDYINERYRKGIDESVDFVRKHSGFAIGIGAIFSVMFLIPYEIGITFAVPLAVVASTLGMDKIMGGLANNPHARKKEV
ncbi:MAG: EI24 domain-containing protein [Flavobacteriales bacterium]